MASAVLRRLCSRVTPWHLRPRCLSVSRPSKLLERSTAVPTALELNQDESVGREIFQGALALKGGVPMTWDALFASTILLFELHNRSIIPLFLELEKQGHLYGYGKCSALRYFLEKDDHAMIEYCLSILSLHEYGTLVFADIIYYLEKQGRHEEADEIAVNSFSSVLAVRTMNRAPHVNEVVQRALRRTLPSLRLGFPEKLAVAKRPYLLDYLHDLPVMEQKGDGHFRSKQYMTKKEFRNAFEKELWLESNPVDSCTFTKVDQLNIASRQSNAPYIAKIKKFLDHVLLQFHEGMAKYIKARQANLRERIFEVEALENGQYTPVSYYCDLILLSMHPERTAKILNNVFYEYTLVLAEKVSAATVLRCLLDVTKYQAAYMDTIKEEQCERLYKIYEDLHYDLPTDIACLPIRHYVNYLISEGETKLFTKEYVYSQYMCMVLAQVMMNTIHIGKFRRLNGEWSRIFSYDPLDNSLRIDPALASARKAFKGARIKKFIDPTKMPLECPPYFTSQLTQGGGKVLISMSNVMKCLTPMQMSDVVSDALDAMGQVAFRLDPRVVDCMTSRLNELQLDRADYVLCIPPALDTLKMIKAGAKDVTGLSDALLAQQAAEEYKGMRQDIGNRLTLCNYFKDERPYWGVPVLDFRGRNYNRSSFLASTSPDVIRGMIRFAAGCPLGANGWDWLRVHLANLHGSCKKKTREQKIEFVNDRMDDIVQTALTPNEGHQFWKEFDSPTQGLIACLEVIDALRSGCPETFISDLPVHQDGSCNGMQHYSALGRDLEGARLVSLSAVPSSLDLYSSVAKRVEAKLIAQLDDDMLPANIHSLAKKCLPYAVRKVVKQTVMTTVYGVTRAGAELQIDRAIKRQYGQAVQDLARISPHLVKTIFEVLDEVFSVARKIQRWLLTCVNRVSQQGLFMTWMTPLGLVVEQPYTRVPVGNIVKLRLLEPKFVLDAGGEFDIRVKEVRSSKHSIAFAPNFIHSLDATHMMMTAMAMRRSGLMYGAVHDSYWAHAAHVDDMNRIIREQFVALYKQPIIENLAAQLQGNFGDPNVNWKEDVFMNYPKPGHFDINEVLQSERFFS